MRMRGGCFTESWRGLRAGGPPAMKARAFSMPPAPSLSIVVPAYNEARRLPPTLERLAAFCAELGKPCEVLIVVERGRMGRWRSRGSLPRDKRASRRSTMKCIAAKGSRCAPACCARGRYRLLHGCRSERSPRRSACLSRALRSASGDRGAAGNRQHAQSRITRRQSWLRRTMGQTFNRLLQRLACVRSADTQCGFKAFRRAAAQAIFSRQTAGWFCLRRGSPAARGEVGPARGGSAGGVD